MAMTSAPRPRPEASIIKVQPVGTATMKPSVRRRPWLAASAADSVVFGPGVKLIAVAKTSRAVSSSVDMAASLRRRANTEPLHFAFTFRDLYWSARQHMTNPPAHGAALSRGADTTLTDQLSARFSERIRQRLLAPGTRLPSVRECARRHGVSAYTVVAAYDQLQAQGLVEARRQRGFFVREPAAEPPRAPSAKAPPPPLPISATTLMRGMFQPPGAHRCRAWAPCRSNGWTCRCSARRCAA
jgi:hypothetical protein